MHLLRVSAAACLLALAACSGGNLRGGRAIRESGPPPPPIANPHFDPYATPGSVPVVWVAPVQDRIGTIVRPRDPIVERDHVDHARAPWAPGRGNPAAPPGTY